MTIAVITPPELVLKKSYQIKMLSLG